MGIARGSLGTPGALSSRHGECQYLHILVNNINSLQMPQMAVTRTSVSAGQGPRDRSRRGARRCLPPLALLAIVFVLPAIRGCGGCDERSGCLPANRPWPACHGMAAVCLRGDPGDLDPGPARGRSDAGPARAVLAAPVLTWLASISSAIVILEELPTKPPPRSGLDRRRRRAAGRVAALDHRLCTRRARARLDPLATCDRFVRRRGLADVPRAIHLRMSARSGGTPRLVFGAYVFAAAMIWLSVAAARRDQTDGRLPTRRFLTRGGPPRRTHWQAHDDSRQPGLMLQ